MEVRLSASLELTHPPSAMKRLSMSRLLEKAAPSTVSWEGPPSLTAKLSSLITSSPEVAPLKGNTVPVIASTKYSLCVSNALLSICPVATLTLNARSSVSLGSIPTLISRENGKSVQLILVFFFSKQQIYWKE
ncbi:MAG: hypothetical protein Q8P67_24215 [archaeon]|nr:hypothetical protein [archaeon]